MSNKKQGKGFSLIELLIYVAILTIVIVLISNYFISLNRGRGKINARSEVDSNMRFSEKKLIQDIKAATAVSVPAYVGLSASTLQLTIPPDTILYDVSGGQLRRKINSQTPDWITSTSTVTVATPTFTRLENYNPILNATTTTIQINLSMSYNSLSPDYKYSESATTTASLR
jgi:Tfp pilus assembly protein FimT